jgi:hypothetical protein
VSRRLREELLEDSDYRFPGLYPINVSCHPFEYAAFQAYLQPFQSQVFFEAAGIEVNLQAIDI